jgi:hypothetical protein
LSKARTKSRKSAASVAEKVAMFIGRSMAELVNRKDALVNQLAEVDAQIAAVQKRVTAQFGQFAGTPRRRRRAAARKASGSSRRVISKETREKMAAAARRRWAATRAAKG